MRYGGAVQPLVIGPVAGVHVRGGGTAFPTRVLSNEDVVRALASRAWPGRELDAPRIEFLARGAEETLGVRSRAWCHVPGEPFDHEREPSSFSLASEAARNALDDARIKPEDVGLVLASTSTPHRMTSTLSAAVAASLSIAAPCMDVRTGCSGGLFALSTAALYLAAGVENVLLVGAETFSKVLPPDNKVAAMALGDGAGALVLANRAGAALRAAALATDGTLGRIITTDGALPPTAGEIERGGYVLSGAPEELAAVVPGKYVEVIEAVLTRSSLAAADCDLFVPHQTSRPLALGVAAKVGVGEGRTFVNVDRHANVGAAGWVVALVEARAEGRVREGDHVLLAAVGGGMSWAAAILAA